MYLQNITLRQHKNVYTNFVPTGNHFTFDLAVVSIESSKYFTSVITKLIKCLIQKDISCLPSAVGVLYLVPRMASLIISLSSMFEKKPLVPMQYFAFL